MSDSRLFFDKELSWLSFNERVLQEAQDASVPIIERIRFLGIYSSNQDEFFRVRVARIRRQALVERAQNRADMTEKDTWSSLLSDIIAKVATLTEKFQKTSEQVFAELAEHNIDLLFNDESGKAFAKGLSKQQIDWMSTFFDNHVLKHITPVIINNSTDLSECLNDDGIYFLAGLNYQDNVQYALVEIPREEVDRFIILPEADNSKVKHIVMLDDVVRYFMDNIFKGFFEFDSIDAYSIKLTRDAEYNLNDELDQSLLDKMSKGLKQRLKAEPVRLGYDQNMPPEMVKFLRKSLRIKELDNLVGSVRYRHFKDFLSFPNLGGEELEKTDIQALDAAAFKHFPSVFEAISHQDILLYYPYYKFNHFTEFVRQASYDPAVREIKLNIYRVAKNSQIIYSLTEAVKNGKQVTVVVELRARFDEQANIEWAKLMKDAGINVEFGIDTLKIHSKLCLVSRVENDKLVRYAHIGTGNFHEKNARIYTDFTLFTKHKEIAQEVDNAFSFIAHSYKRFRFNHLIVSPLTSRRRLYQLIDNEIEFANQGKKAEITIKVNNLVDTGLINRLYNASSSGVKIKLIVRGMCALVPGIKGVSDNIKAISIVDQFLEHPRVMVFHNGGEKSVYISSADWMERNIDQRVEIGCPIYDEKLKKRIIDILALHFKDTTKARVINQQQNNRYVAKGNRKPLRSQIAIYDYLCEQEQADLAAWQQSDTEE